MSEFCKLQSLIYLRLAKASARRSGVHYITLMVSRTALENLMKNLTFAHLWFRQQPRENLMMVSRTTLEKLWITLS